MGKIIYIEGELHSTTDVKFDDKTHMGIINEISKNLVVGGDIYHVTGDFILHDKTKPFVKERDDQIFIDDIFNNYDVEDIIIFSDHKPTE